MVDRVDGGTGPGRCEIRTGAPETNVSDASTGTLLGTPVFAATAFGAAAAGVATADPIVSDINAADSGDAGHFRTYQGAAADSSAEWQGTAGEIGDTPDMVFDNKTVVQGGTIAITAMTYTQPIQ
jgi:hypothetical protein